MKNEYQIVGKEVHMKLTKGQITVFDKQFLESILDFKWFAQYSNSMKKYYAYGIVNGKRVPLHREILCLVCEWRYGLEVDHIDHDTLDNRLCNLRAVTHAVNMRNKNLRSDNRTGYVGVSIYRTGKFKSSITCNGTHYHLGLFECPIEAAKKYNEMAIKFGFEMLNNV